MANDTETTDISETWQKGDAVRRVGSAAARVQAQYDGFTLVDGPKTAAPKKRAAKKTASRGRKPAAAANDQAPSTETVDSSAAGA